MSGNIQIGDWVQAREDIYETDFDGTPLALIAKRGGVGHVMGADTYDGIFCFTVTFERTGMSSSCAPEELKRLCDYRGAVAA